MTIAVLIAGNSGVEDRAASPNDFLFPEFKIIMEIESKQELKECQNDGTLSDSASETSSQDETERSNGILEDIVYKLLC